jgi:hypothetical protein
MVYLLFELQRTILLWSFYRRFWRKAKCQSAVPPPSSDYQQNFIILPIEVYLIWFELGTDHLGDVGGDGKTILIKDLKVWTECIWLRIQTSGRLLWTRRAFSFHKRREISWLQWVTISFSKRVVLCSYVTNSSALISFVMWYQS